MHFQTCQNPHCRRGSLGISHHYPHREADHLHPRCGPSTRGPSARDLRFHQNISPPRSLGGVSARRKGPSHFCRNRQLSSVGVQDPHKSSHHRHLLHCPHKGTGGTEIHSRFPQARAHRRSERGGKGQREEREARTNTPAHRGGTEQSAD